MTLLCDGPRSALELSSLSRCEVHDLVVLHDPPGEFARARVRAREESKRIWRTLCQNTSRALAAELGAAGRGPRWKRLALLRDAALRLASAWAYRAFGWRTPRWRTLRRVLPREEVRTLEGVLGLPAPAESRLALGSLARALARAKLGPLPPEVRARVRCREWNEAVLLARRHVEREVLPGRVTRGADLPPALVSALARLHGVERDDPSDCSHEARLLSSACRALRVLRWFEPSVATRLDSLQVAVD